MTLLAQKIWTYLESLQTKMTSTLESLVSIETPSRDKASQSVAMQLLQSKLEDEGYYVRHFAGNATGGYLYARPQSRKRTQPCQLMIGHCDTVWPINTLRQMPIQVKDGKMHGPGVYDMKAGLVQILYAIHTIRALDLDCEVTPVVLINSDEEIGSRESKHIIKRLARTADRAFVLEPALGPDGKLKTTRKGVGRFNVKVVGKAAHAGLDPQKGTSAIAELSHVIQKLFALNDPARGISVNVGMIEGGISANVVAPESRAIVDVRVPTQADAIRIERAIQGITPSQPDVQILIDGGIGRPPMEATTRNEQLWELARSQGQALNIDLEQAMAGGGSDGNFTSLHTATLDGLGAVGDGAHAIYEHINTDKMVERTALLVLLLLAQPLKD